MPSKYSLHHFFNYIPDNLHSITGLAVNDDIEKVAVLKRSLPKDENEYSTTTIEIWNHQSSVFFIEQRIHDDYKQPQLAEAIAWGANDRLFTVGLNEKLNEINLLNGSIKKSYQLISGPAYCMKFNAKKNLVAVGTDHGYICVFSICESSKKNEVAVVKSLKITRKVFSLDWYEKDNETLIVCSTTEQIRIFDYKTGLQRDIIYLDSKDCHIWSVCALPSADEFVIVSGDSNGNVIFWDGLTCTQIQSLKPHDNDVNAVCYKNEKRAFSIGVDGKLCKFSYLNGRVIMQGNQQYVSNYELKSIASSESANCLFVGGADSELKKADPTSQSIKRIQQGYQQFIHNYDHYMMYQLDKSLRVYKLDHEISSQPIYLGTLSSKKEIIASAINKKYIAFADYHKTTILTRKDDKFKKLGIIQNSNLDYNLKNLFLIKNTLYIQTSRTVHQFNLSKLKENDENLEENKVKFKQRIFKVSISKNFIAIILESSKVEFYDLNLNSISSLEASSLPLICEWQTDSICWFITNNNYYIIYDLDAKKILGTDELKEYLNSKDFDKRNVIEGLTFTPQSTVIYTKTRIWSINNETLDVILNQTYKNIVKFAKLNDEEYYLVDLPMHNQNKHLPPRVARKKFGLK